MKKSSWVVVGPYHEVHACMHARMHVSVSLQSTHLPYFATTELFFKSMEKKEKCVKVSSGLECLCGDTLGYHLLLFNFCHFLSAFFFQMVPEAKAEAATILGKVVCVFTRRGWWQ